MKEEILTAEEARRLAKNAREKKEVMNSIRESAILGDTKVILENCNLSIYTIEWLCCELDYRVIDYTSTDKTQKTIISWD